MESANSKLLGLMAGLVIACLISDHVYLNGQIRKLVFDVVVTKIQL